MSPPPTGGASLTVADQPHARKRRRTPAKPLPTIPPVFLHHQIPSPILHAKEVVGELAKRALVSVQMMARNGEVAVRADPRILATDACRAGTTLHVRDGETVGIGGLVQQNSEDRSSKLPVLGDMPILGALFRTTDTVNVESELIIFITPNVIDPADESDAPPPQLRRPPAAEPPGAASGKHTRKPVGLELSIETKVDDVVSSFSAATVSPRNSFVLFGSGLRLATYWDVQVPFLADRTSLTLAESYEFVPAAVPLVVRAENQNTFPLNAGAVSGAASAHITFVDVFSLGVDCRYLPALQLSATVGVGYELAPGGAFAMSIGEETRVDLFPTPKLKELAFRNSYSLVLGAFRAEAGVYPIVHPSGPTGVRLSVSPYLQMSYEF